MHRPPTPRLLALTLFAAIVLALAAPAGAQAQTDYRGVMLHSLWYESSDAELDRELDLARGLGANAVRVDVAWSSLETEGKGRFSEFYVSRLDRFMSGAAARGIKIVAMLHTTPCWASSAPATLKQGCSGSWWERGVSTYVPADPADYADAARWLTSRYGTRLAALEVWNEPNLHQGGTFEGAANKAVAYAQLLRATYPAAKQGNAGVPVLAGSLSFADRPFLEALEAAGIKGNHDGLAVHPYNEWRDPADAWKDEFKKWTFVPGLNSIHDALVAAGDDKPIWVTEFGWTTGTASRWKVSEAQQGAYLAKGFRLLAGMPWVKAALAYNLREKNSSPADEEGNFGIVNRDFSPKPAFAAVRAALRGTKPARRVRLTVRIQRRAGVAYAVGTAPARGRVRLLVSRCRRVGPARLTVRAASSARFTKRLGPTVRLAGCRVNALIAGARASGR